MIRRSLCQCVVALTVTVAALNWLSGATAQSPNPLTDPRAGVSLANAGVYEGYSLVAPMNSTSTYLIDLQGRIVKEWKSEFTPALSAYLLENGHLLRPAADRAGGGGGFAPGAGGRIQEFDWDGNLVWDYVVDIEGIRPHHDICKLPSGNVLVIATEAKTADEAIAAGRKPESVTEQLLPDCLLEIKPTGRTTGEIVWEWHAWDHLVQDVDQSKPNYGEVSDHPELIDINFGSREFDRMMRDPQQLARLRSLGYIGGGPPQNTGGVDDAPDTDENSDDRSRRRDEDGRANSPTDGRRPDGGPGRRGPGMQGDWMHTNSVAYNAELDQIVLSIHNFSEIWIIDHGTTTAEAAAHAGGKSGQGGDLLYRWGNPQAYRNGSQHDQRLFAQHCAHWIAAGLPGAGHILVFNNGQGRPDGAYSSVEEIETPLAANGIYQREEFLAYGPERACWSFSAEDKQSFFSMLVSGAQRLPNGNTFICSGNQSLLFELTPAGKIVWTYKHPGGSMGLPGIGGRIGMFPEFVRRMLQTSGEQDGQLAELQTDIDAQLARVLTDVQRKQMEQPPAFPFGGRPVGGAPPGAVPPPGIAPRAGRDGRPARPDGRSPRGFRPPRFGEVIPPLIVDSLELTNEQQSQIAKLQESVDQKLKGILSDQQRQQVDEWSRMFARGPGKPPRDGNGPPAGGAGIGRMFGGPGGGPGRGPGGMFRAYRYGPDYPGLVGKDLTPGAKLADVVDADSRPSERPNRPSDGPGDNRQD